MLGFGKPKPVAEYEAEGEIERVYHEIRMVLRVSGVNLNFRIWATFGEFLPAMWDALRPTLETRTFEDAADQIRSQATTSAAALPRLDSTAGLHLGDSQAYQIQAALDLYHYINPKLLVLTSAVLLALEGEGTATQGNAASERIERGEPTRMFPMEMAPEDPDDPRLQAVFEDMKSTLDLPSINSDYRTLALWPDYLESGWNQIKPLIAGNEYQQAAAALQNSARSLARALPIPTGLTLERVSALGEDADAVREKTLGFEKLLPKLILNITLFHLDWKSPELLAKSPFPAANGTEATR